MCTNHDDVYVQEWHQEKRASFKTFLLFVDCRFQVSGIPLLGSILCPEGNAHRELSEHTENYVRTKEIMGALVGLWEHASIYWRNDIDFNKVEGIKHNCQHHLSLERKYWFIL